MTRERLTREKVVELAATLADKDGWDALTLASLAEAAEIRSPSLYKHVDGLDGLRRELALLSLRRLDAVLTDAVMGRSGDDAILSLIRAYRTFLTKHPGLGRALERAPDRKDKELIDASERIIQISLAALRERTPDREVALHAIRAIRAMVHGFSALERAGGFGMPMSLNESFDRMIAAWLKGLS